MTSSASLVMSTAVSPPQTLPNPETSLAWLPPGDADQLEASRYLYCVILGVGRPLCVQNHFTKYSHRHGYGSCLCLSLKKHESIAGVNLVWPMPSTCSLGEWLRYPSSLIVSLTLYRISSAGFIVMAFIFQRISSFSPIH